LIKCGLSTLFAIKKIIKSPKRIIDGFISKDSIKFGLFICAFLLVFRSIVCFMRRKTQPQNEKYAFLLAGFVSGTLSALILDKKSRQTFGLFLIARAIDITYRTLVEKKIVPDFKYFYPVLSGISMAVSTYTVCN
jgi:low temperature requirement protein LtrA